MTFKELSKALGAYAFAGLIGQNFGNSFTTRKMNLTHARITVAIRKNHIASSLAPLQRVLDTYDPVTRNTFTRLWPTAADVYFSYKSMELIAPSDEVNIFDTHFGHHLFPQQRRNVHFLGPQKSKILLSAFVFALFLIPFLDPLHINPSRRVAQLEQKSIHNRM